MKITFHGAAGTVTGSRFLLDAEQARLLVDCGLFQGYKNLRQLNRRPLPFDARSLDAIVLTHAHLDHSGYLPVLHAQGFRGPVYCEQATAELCGILLPDSGHIQEEEAAFLNRHKISRHNPPLPLYDRAQAIRSLDLLRPVAFGSTIRVRDLSVSLQPAGHILGAASILVDTGSQRLLFSGDLGRESDLLMQPPAPMPECDVLCIESTYGDRLHDRESAWDELAVAVSKTVRDGGVLAVPCFAVGRAQLLQYMLDELMSAGKVPEVPVFLDSPMAIDASEVYWRHCSQHRLSHPQCVRLGHRTKVLRTQEESRSLNSLNYPHIILAGSGMVTGGRILHHLKRLLPSPRNTVLLTGFQAGGTRGARLAAGEQQIKIHGEFYPVRARVRQMHGLSAHADQRELLNWATAGQHPPQQIFVVHGEPQAADELRFRLSEALPACRISTPAMAETFEL